MATGTFSKEKKAQIKGELEDLLRGYDRTESGDDNMDNQLAEIAAAPPIDFEKMNADFEKQAKKITESMLKFYADLGILTKHDYAREKQKLDNSSISNIFFQLKTIRMAIEKIVEEINQGNTHPRLFEVFGQLQDKLTVAVKTQANYVLFLESTYKNLKTEVEQAEGGGTNQQNKQLAKSSNEYYITAGTKNLIKDLDVEEITEDHNKDERHLTHPSMKSEVMLSRGITDDLIAEDESENFFDDVNSLI